MELKKKIERMFKGLKEENYSAFIVVVGKDNNQEDESKDPVMVTVKKTGRSSEIINGVSCAMEKSDVIYNIVHAAARNVE